MGASVGRLAALAGIPPASRHVQGGFGPATLRLAGARAVLELDDGGTPPLRLSWTDGPQRLVGPLVAALLRTSGTAELERPDLLRVAGRRKITDPPLPPGTPAAPRSVRVIATDDGVRVEIDPPQNATTATRAVVLSATQARDLADLLEAWAALPPG